MAVAPLEVATAAGVTTTVGGGGGGGGGVCTCTTGALVLLLLVLGVETSGGAAPELLGVAGDFSSELSTLPPVL